MKSGSNPNPDNKHVPSAAPVSHLAVVGGRSIGLLDPVPRADAVVKFLGLEDTVHLLTLNHKTRNHCKANPYFGKHLFLLHFPHRMNECLSIEHAKRDYLTELQNNEEKEYTAKLSSQPARLLFRCVKEGDLKKIRKNI